MISKGTHKPLTDTADKGCAVGWCFIPSWTRGALSCGSDRSKQEHDNNVSRKRQKLMEQSSHHNNKLERLLFDEIRQCDVCGKNLLYRPATSCEEESIAEALPKFIEKHITCQSPLPCRWCNDTSDKNNTYICCESMFCSDKCRTRAECALYDDDATTMQANDPTSCSRDAETKLLMPPPKLFFCRNRFQERDSNRNNDVAYDLDLAIEAIQSLVAIETKLRVLCGNNLGLEECALMITTIISVVSPWWVDDFLQSFSGDAHQDGSAYEESLTEELWTMARSHWSIVMLLQSKERSNDTDTSKRLFMSYEMFCQTYLCIKRQCISRVALPDHPLIQYSKDTLLSADKLSDIERDLALDILEHPCLPISRHAQSKTSTDQQSIIRWRNAAHTAHWLSNAASLEEGKGVSQIQSHLGRTYFVFSPWAYRKMQHSCCPVAMLDVQDPSSPLDSLSWMSLHDVEEGNLTFYSTLGYLEGDTRSRAVELKKLFGSDFTCSCTRCRYENDNTGNKSGTLPFSQLQLKSLADLAMQHGRFADAIGLYELILESHPCDGNVLHARAAAVLGTASNSFGDKGHCNGHFLRAQRLWKEAGSKCSDHPEIALHVDKQRMYGTVDSLDDEIDDSSSSSNIQYSTHLNGKCFVTSKATPLLSEDECQLIIKTAEEHCNSSTGWTTTRHYAVPTTDIPIHEITKLHDLFTKKLWSSKIRPLLRQQLKLNGNRQILIHDAFVVRYDSSKQRYLPPHLDESSHSFIIALNSEFKGGGTYIHELERVLSPTVGGMVSFEGGSLLHSGDPVVSGIRYCIVAFCYIDNVGEQTAKTAEVEKDNNTNAPFSFGFQFG
ncbi:2OG-Fe(II) oxygenase family protein [Skeletonema marinoi]|uniref:2OG-Fe(II) oxygenase family protein n=2 Tax=Skeletonema marinoi TaxID=267567 RepID=A0AAD8Y6D5_9STRA|nr:2OG-Fe(II) oxygenase family protein [Skeletonema marinoi]